MEPTGSLPHLQDSATCPYPKPDESSPCLPSHFFKIRFNVILPFTPTSSKWSHELPTETTCTPVLSPVRATCPVHLILYLTTRIIFSHVYRSRSLLCTFLPPPVTSVFCQNTLSTLISNTLSLWSTPSVGYHVWRSYNQANTNHPSVIVLACFCPTDVSANYSVVVIFMVLLLDSYRRFVCGNYVEVSISVVGVVWLKHEAIQEKTVISTFEQIR